MFTASNRSTRLSLGRRLTCDFLHAGMQIPLVSIQKTMHLSELPAARRQAHPRPSWCAIFTKAFARVAASRPDLRQSFLTFPWERIYHQEATTADVVVEAQVAQETILVTVPMKRPDSTPLPEMDRYVRECREKPLERLHRFRRALFFARFPRFIRRTVWWGLLNVSGKARAQYFGTFGVTSVGNWGVDSLRPIAPWTCLIHYGAIDAEGRIAMRLTYDHRVLDGSGPATALVEMEQVLQTDILAELKTLRAGESSPDLAKAG